MKKNKTKIRYISCRHKELKKESVYSYTLNGNTEIPVEIELCPSCNRELLGQMLSQMVLEHSLQPFNHKLTDNLIDKLTERVRKLEENKK